jgi:hypothetical protein
VLEYKRSGFEETSWKTRNQSTPEQLPKKKVGSSFPFRHDIDIPVMSLRISKIGSLFQQETNKNGVDLFVHWVVKNSPFNIELETDDLKSGFTGLDVKLLYQGSGEEVLLPKSNAVEFVTKHIESQRALIEVRYAIASFQKYLHFFRHRHGVAYTPLYQYLRFMVTINAIF